MPISLDSPDWLKMASWFGVPDEVPRLLRRWLETRDGNTLDELLWSRLSAQGTYSRSAIAALPYLTRDLETLPVDQQEEICWFAGMTAQQPEGGEHTLSLEHAERVATSLLLAKETPTKSASGLLWSIAMFQAWERGASFFERFGRDTTELWATCAACDAGLLLQLEPGRGWCKLDGRDESHSPVCLVVLASDTKHAESQRVVELLERRVAMDGSAAESLSSQFMLFMGTTKCPACDAEVSVPDSVM